MDAFVDRIDSAMNRSAIASIQGLPLSLYLTLLSIRQSHHVDVQAKEQAKQAMVAAAASSSWEEAKAAGNAAYSNGKYEEAIAHFTEAIALDPANASAQLHVFHSNRSAAHAALGDAAAALADADQCVRANAGFAKGHSRRGAALFRLGRFQDAAAAYEAGLALEPSNAEMKKALADARKAAVESRPLGMGELRPKLHAFLANNALAARLALPRMLLVLATVRRGVHHGRPTFDPNQGHRTTTPFNHHQHHQPPPPNPHIHTQTHTCRASSSSPSSAGPSPPAATASRWPPPSAATSRPSTAGTGSRSST